MLEKIQSAAVNQLCMPPYLRKMYQDDLPFSSQKTREHSEQISFVQSKCHRSTIISIAVTYI